jgi:hypothetical protein
VQYIVAGADALIIIVLRPGYNRARQADPGELQKIKHLLGKYRLRRETGVVCAL